MSWRIGEDGKDFIKVAVIVYLFVMLIVCSIMGTVWIGMKMFPQTPKTPEEIQRVHEIRLERAKAGRCDG